MCYSHMGLRAETSKQTILLAPLEGHSLCEWLEFPLRGLEHREGSAQLCCA